jgi:hypothetical protein
LDMKSWFTTLHGQKAMMVYLRDTGTFTRHRKVLKLWEAPRPPPEPPPEWDKGPPRALADGFQNPTLRGGNAIGNDGAPWEILEQRNVQVLVPVQPEYYQFNWTTSGKTANAN